MSTNSPTDWNYSAAFTKIFLESYFNPLKQMLVGIQLLCSLVITVLHFALGVLVLLGTEATLTLLSIKQMRYHASLLPNTTDHLRSINSMPCAIPVSKHIKKMCHIREDRSKQQAQLGPNTNKMEATNKWKKSLSCFFLAHKIDCK